MSIFNQIAASNMFGAPQRQQVQPVQLMAPPDLNQGLQPQAQQAPAPQGGGQQSATGQMPDQTMNGIMSLIKGLFGGAGGAAGGDAAGAAMGGMFV